MGLKIETWNIAYRMKQGSFLQSGGAFKVINNGRKGWYADPFIYEYNNETFLFAEFYSYKLSRGIIVCSQYNKCKESFSEFRDIIIEDYHLSYPVIFKFNGNIYMLPESSKSNNLFLYECKEFPYKWKKKKLVMENIKLVDTTPFIIDDRLYALTLRLDDNKPGSGDLLLLEFINNKFVISSQQILSNDMKFARPGGNCFRENENFYRVSQKCDNGYGEALNFIKLNENFLANYKEEIKSTVFPSDILLLNKKNKPDGIHTYNFSPSFEVVDLKYYKRSYYRIMLKIIKLLKNK